MKKENLIRINRLAGPILLNYLVNILFETLDKMIVGHYSTLALSAVGVGASLTYVITGCFGVVSNAYHIQAAEYRGQKQMADFYALFLKMIKIAFWIGVVWIMICFFGSRLFFSEIIGLQGQFLLESTAYFKVSSLTVLLNLLAFVFSVFYRNQEDTRKCFYFTVVSTSVNLFFDISLVFGKFGLPELGAVGAAWGSVIGLAAGMMVYLLPLRKLPLKNKKISLKRIRQLFIPLFCQDFLESTLFTFFLTGFVAGLGVENTAVYQLNDTLLGFLMLVSYAYASACSTLVIQSRAAGKADVWEIRKLSFSCSSGILCVAGMLLLVDYSCFYRLITTSQEIVLLSGNYLQYVLLLAILFVEKQIDQSILQGCGREKEVMIVSAAANIAGLITAKALCIFGLKGIYAGLVMRSFVYIFGNYILLKEIRSE